MQPKRYLPLLLAISCIVAGCATTGINRYQFNVYSLQDDEQVGQVLSQRISREFKLADDPFLNNYVNDIGQKLVATVDDPLFRYRFHVVNGKEVNAFAIPGGHVYVYTGLMKAIENESELAAVVGHEIAHVYARHGTETMSKGHVIAIGAAVIGPEWGQAVQLFGTTGLLFYGRKAELEADTLGVKNLHKANYSVRGMVTLMEKFRATANRDPSLLEVLFSTHPAPKDRIENAEKINQTLPSQVNPIITTERFQTMKEAIKKYL